MENGRRIRAEKVQNAKDCGASCKDGDQKIYSHLLASTRRGNDRNDGNDNEISQTSSAPTFAQQALAPQRQTEEGKHLQGDTQNDRVR